MGKTSSVKEHQEDPRLPIPLRQTDQSPNIFMYEPSYPLEIIVPTTKNPSGKRTDYCKRILVGKESHKLSTTVTFVDDTFKPGMTLEELEELNPSLHFVLLEKTTDSKFLQRMISTIRRAFRLE